MPDGSLVFDTRVDLKGFEKGYKALESRAKEAAEIIAGAGNEAFDRVSKAAQDAAEDFTQDISGAYLDAEESIRNSAAGINESTKSIGSEAEKAAENAETSFDQAYKDISEGADELEVRSLAVFAAIAVAAKEALSGIGDYLADSGRGMSKFVARTGMGVEAAEEFRGVMLEIYQDNFGESFEDIADGMGSVYTLLDDLDPAGLKEVTEQAYLLQDVFGFDIPESVRSAKMLMDQFGVSAGQAYTLIAQGAQQGLDKNGDLLDTINEYAVHFHQLGYDAEGMFAALISGAEGGTFSVDKLGDAVKEFGIRVVDGSDTSIHALEALGLDADATMQAFAAGGEKAQEAMRLLTQQLFQMDDPILQNQVGVELFGTMWEDLGKTGVEAMLSLNAEVDKTADTLEELNAIRYDNIGDAFAGLGRTIQTALLEPIGKELMPAVEDLEKKFSSGGLPKAAQKTGKALATLASDGAEVLTGAIEVGAAALELITDNLWILVPAAKTAATALAAYMAVTKGKKAWEEITNLWAAGVQVLGKMREGATLAAAAEAAHATATAGQAAATGSATVAQNALNAAMAANPVGLVVAGVAALVAILWTLGDALFSASEETEAQIDANKRLTDSIEDNRKAYDDRVDSMEQDAAASKALIGKIKELSAVENKSAAQKKMLASYVDMLNKQMPELNLAYDEQADALSMTNDELEHYVDNMLEAAKMEAAQERLVELYKEQAELEERRAEALDHYMEVANNGSLTSAWETGDYSVAKQAWQEMDDAVEQHRQKIADAETAYSDMAAESVEATAAAKTGTQDLMATQQLEEEQLQRLVDLTGKYAEVTTDAFGQIEQKEGITLATMTANMEANQQAIADYTEKMGILAGSALVSDDTLDYLYGLGPEYIRVIDELVAAVQADTEESRKKLLDFQDVRQAGLDSAAELAKQQVLGYATALSQSTEAETAATEKMESVQEAMATSGEDISDTVETLIAPAREIMDGTTEDLQGSFNAFADWLGKRYIDILTGWQGCMILFRETGIFQTTNMVEGIEEQMDKLQGIGSSAGNKMVTALQRAILSRKDALLQEVAKMAAEVDAAMKNPGNVTGGNTLHGNTTNNTTTVTQNFYTPVANSLDAYNATKDALARTIYDRG